MNYGFVKIATAVPEVRVADPKFNTQQIENLVIQAEGRGVEIICLPELSLTGYSCGDLFGQQLLLDEAEMALINLMNFSRSLDIITIVGLPVSYNGMLLNCAAVIQKGRILGLVPKTFLPNYQEFYERRWFASAIEIPANATVWLCGQQVNLSSHMLFRTPTCTFGVELCEDLWAPIPPSSELALRGAEIIFNLSADDDVVGKLCGRIRREHAGRRVQRQGHDSGERHPARCCRATQPQGTAGRERSGRGTTAHSTTHEYHFRDEPGNDEPKGGTALQGH